MTETVNYATGEIATVDPSSEVAVTSYLQQARDWLATAVETTGPEQIARAKAEIATAAEASKQLGLSKEIQGDAAEMVRRAEYAVRKAVTKAQESGEVHPRFGARVSPAGDTASADSFFTSRKEYQDANAMADLEPDEFDEVLTEARAEENLSRSNVAAKARQKRDDILTDLSAGYVDQFPALAFFRDRGEHQRVNALGRDLAAMDAHELSMRLEILDKTIAYERRKAAGSAARHLNVAETVESDRGESPDATSLVEHIQAVQRLMKVVSVSEVADKHQELIADVSQMLASLANRIEARA